MSRECDACSEREGREVSVYDTSGAVAARVCEMCLSRLRHRHSVFQDGVCVFCAEFAEPSRARGLDVMRVVRERGRDAPVYHVCDSCRHDLLNQGHVVETRRCPA